MAADEDGDPIHPHCLNCVSVAKCSARLEKRTSCQIVHCKLDCGASFHSCKGQEHQLLCPNVKVPCTNAINGCPVWLLRSQVASHLQHCPASLVYCTAEWNRWGWLGDTTGEPHCVDRSGKLQLDFALAMRDLRSLRNDSHFGKPCRGSKDDRMPVATAPRDVGIAHSIVCTCDGICSESDTLDSKSTLGTLNGYMHHVGEMLDIKEEVAKCNDVDYRLMRVAGACYASRPGVALNVELCVEFLTRYQLKPDKVYTFSCGQVFRRDEYAWHYQNVHRDIHCGLNGWLEHRCPLAQYGCSFSKRRFHPAPSGSQLVYNEVLESFGLAFPMAMQQNEQGGKGNIEEEEGDHIANGHAYNNSACDESSAASLSSNGPAFLDFPFEVLQHIAAYLDAFSLNNFSLVSKRLRDVSCSLLKSRGMVDFKWEKLGADGWIVGTKSWYFSNGFTPIRKWVFSDGEHMSNHLRECSYFDRNIKTMPTAVCFGIGNSRGPKTLLHLAL